MRATLLIVALVMGGCGSDRPGGAGEGVGGDPGGDGATSGEGEGEAGDGGGGGAVAGEGEGEAGAGDGDEGVEDPGGEGEEGEGEEGEGEEGEGEGESGDGDICERFPDHPACADVGGEGEGEGEEGEGEEGEGEEGEGEGEVGGDGEGIPCGPPDRPCRMAAAPLQIDPPHHRNDAPAIAVDGDGLPRILFSVAEGGYHARFAQLGLADEGGDGEWITDPAPMALARGGLAVLPDSTWVGVTYDGANHLSRYVHVDRQAWDLEGEWQGQRTLIAHGVDADRLGRVHITPFGGNGGPVEWVTRRANGQLDDTVQIAARGQHAVVGVGTDNEGHVTWWSSEGGRGWELMYTKADNVRPEVVLPLGGGALSVQSHALAVEAGRDQRGIDVPHILAMGGQPLALTHIWRGARGGWQTDEIAEDEPSPGCGNGGQPEEGEECETESVRYLPIDAVASPDHRHIRFLYSRIHTSTKMTAGCQGGGGMPPFCDWQVVENNITQSLHIAWPSPDGGTESVRLQEGIGGVGTAAIDGQGRIHVAVYAAGGLPVMYLRLD